MDKNNDEVMLWLEAKGLVDVSLPLDGITHNNLRHLLIEEVRLECEELLKDLGGANDVFRAHTHAICFLQNALEQLDESVQVRHISAVAPVTLHIETFMPYVSTVEDNSGEELTAIVNDVEPGTQRFNNMVEKYIRTMDEQAWHQHHPEEVLEYRWCLIEAGDPTWHHVNVAVEEWTVDKLLRDYGLWVGVRLAEVRTENALVPISEYDPFSYLDDFSEATELLQRGLMEAFLDAMVVDEERRDKYLDENFAWDVE